MDEKLEELVAAVAKLTDRVATLEYRHARVGRVKAGDREPMKDIFMERDFW